MPSAATTRALRVVCQIAVLMWTAASVAAAAEHDRRVACAECVAFNVTPDQAIAIADRGVRLHHLPVLIRAAAIDGTIVDTVAALHRASADIGLELPLAALPIAASNVPDIDLFVIDARASSISDEDRYALRTAATELRARHPHLKIGCELKRDQVDTAAISQLSSLSPYFDFVVLPAEFDIEAVTTVMRGIEVWTRAITDGRVDFVDLVSDAPGRFSENVLVDLPDDISIVTRIAILRPLMPRGMTPLEGVSIVCDAACDASVFLNPHTLDAIALVRPAASVTRIAVRPAASDLDIYADGTAHADGSDIRVRSIATPFAVRIRGWRGRTDDVFGTALDVRAARQLRVDEIIARHQAAVARQRSIVASVISSGSTVLTFQVPGFAGPFTVTASTIAYSAGDLTEIQQEAIRVNGLALQQAASMPRLPLIEPERVSTPPLTIALTDAYRYTLCGIERVGGRDAYIVAFEPLRSDRTLFAGTAWIDATTFGTVRIDAVQTALTGPIVSSRQIDEFELMPYGNEIVSLLRRSESFQVYQGPTESTPIRRAMTFARHEVNARDFAARLDTAHRSTAVMLRDTSDGFRYLVPDARGRAAAAEPRRLAPDATSHVTTAIAGTVLDPNITVPLVFAGLSYVDFNLLGTGAQLNAFFGGTYARLSWSTPPLFRGWRVTGDGAAVAVSYNDRAIVHDVERYDENVRQRPAQLSIALVGPLARQVRLRASYDLNYTAYSRADTTSPAFVVPASTPVHALRLTLESEHGPWTATAWSSVARRQRWTMWGLASNADVAGRRDFARFGATLARSFVWSPRAVGRVEAVWMSGSRLDRFSQFAFGTFDNTLRGYPAVSIRYSSGAAVRSVVTWSASSHLRLDAFADVGVVRSVDETRWRRYPGIGAAVETPVGFGWLAAAEWGYGIKGVNTNGATGTHVVRLTAYKMF